MNYEEKIMEVLEQPLIKSSLDIINYYILKSLYDKNFKFRSRIFIRKLFEAIYDPLNDINQKIFREIILNTKTTNEDKNEKFIQSLIDKGDASILDENEYIITYLLNNFIFSQELPENSNLMLSYHLFCSEIELQYINTI